MLSFKDLADIYSQYQEAFDSPVQNFKLGSVEFRWQERSAIMGVINRSAGSWYRESVVLSNEAAIQRGRVLMAQGATLLDIGAESTLAHTDRVNASEQIAALVPVVKALTQEGAIISVETYAAEVAHAALEAGAQIINLTGTERSVEMFEVIARYQAAVILCYLDVAPGTATNVREVVQFDLVRDPYERMEAFFKFQVDQARSCGIDKMFLDPGLGFYYQNLQDSSFRIQHQMRTFLHTFRLRKLGVPLCHALPHAFEVFGEEVRSAEPFFAVLAAIGGTNLFRTHEVPKVKAVLETLSLWKGNPN